MSNSPTRDGVRSGAETPHSRPAPTPSPRHGWHRLRAALLVLLSAALLPLFVTLPAHATTPASPRAALAAALSRQGISVADASATPTGQATQTTPTAVSPTASSPTTSASTDGNTAPTAAPAVPATQATSPESGAPTTSATPADTAPAVATAANPAPTTGSTDPTNGPSDTTAEQPTDSGGDQATGTWTISDSVRQFLAGLDLTFGDGPLTGTLTGTTLIVNVDPPALPLTLPGGITPTVTAASIAIDEATGTLTLTGAVDAGNGIGGSVSVTIAHSASTDLTGSGGTDLSSTVTLTGVPVLGTTVDLTGTLADTGGTVSASITGTLDDDLVVAPDMVRIAKGTSVTLSTSDGLALSGTVIIGSGDAAVAVDITGTLKGAKDFSLTVADTTAPPSFAPTAGLTLTPAFTGSITDTDGALSLDLSADDVATWTPTTDVTLAVKHIEVSNTTPASTLSRPSSFKDGDLWVDVTGQVSEMSAGLSATGGAFIDLTAQAFTVSATEQGGFGPSDLGFGLSGANLSVTGDVKAGTVSASVGATLTLSAVPGSPSIPVTLDFASDGSFTAAASVDLSQLGLGSGSGALLLSSKEIKNYAPGDGTTIDLPAGITVLLSYQPNEQVKQVLTELNVPVPHQVQAQATLSTTGFSIALNLDLGAGAGGSTCCQAFRAGSTSTSTRCTSRWPSPKPGVRSPSAVPRCCTFPPCTPARAPPTST